MSFNQLCGINNYTVNITHATCDTKGSITFDPNIMYVVDGTARLGKFNTKNGEYTYLVTIQGDNMTAIAATSDGKLYGIDGGNLFEINKITGISTLITSTPGNGMDSLNDNILFIGSNQYIYSGNTDGTNWNTFAYNNSYSCSGDLAWDPITNHIYTSSSLPYGDSLFKCDLQGNLTLIGSIGFGGVYGLAVSNGILYGYSGDKQIIIDRNTGIGSFDETLIGFNDTVWDVASVDKLPYNYSYNWLGYSETGTTLSNLDSGKYSLLIENMSTSGNCIYTFEVTGGTNCCLNFDYTCSIGNGIITNPYIRITGVSGGTAPYYYSLTGLAYQTGDTFNNLIHGNHIIYVRDSGVCSSFKTTYIPKPPTISVQQNACQLPDGGVNISINFDRGVNEQKYTDDSGNVWTVLKENPYLNRCGD